MANVWQNEFKSALRTRTELNDFFETLFPETSYKTFIPRPLAHKIKGLGPNSALWKQFLPSDQENDQDDGLYDPIGDKVHAKGNGIIHRYKNRVLFLPTLVCPIVCRYCFRKNEIEENDSIFEQNFKKAFEYLNDHTEINEVIFSGGDPLILADSKIQQYLEQFSKIPHLKYIRFHTRTPIILPSRITESFIKTLQGFQKRFKIKMVIHVNHDSELGSDVLLALKKLTDASIPLLAQTVLLKGINDTEKNLINLYEQLIDSDIAPYYLHHPDKVKGSMHYYLSLEKGREIYAKLRNQLPGWALPQYVFDIPGGHGKTQAFNPESYQFSGSLISKDGLLVENL